MIHHLSDVIERISEFLRVRPIAVSEAWDNQARPYDNDRKAGQIAARTFATKKEVRAAGESLAHLSGRPLCRKWIGHRSASCDKKSGTSWDVPFGWFRLCQTTVATNSRHGQRHPRAVPSSPLFNFPSLEPRETPLCRSACARKPRLLFRVDKFQSLHARRLFRRSSMCPRNRLVFRRPSPESFCFR